MPRKIKKEKRMILLVEDEPDVRNIYETKLEKEGFKVISADSGAGVAVLASREKPDLILLDLVLPLKEGFVVLEELKKNKKTKDIPVIILSNLAQDYEIKTSQRLGAAAYLTKVDSTPDEVTKTIREFLK